MGLGSSWRGMAYARLNGLRRSAGLPVLMPRELNALTHWQLIRRIREAEEAMRNQANLFQPKPEPEVSRCRGAKVSRRKGRP